MSDCTCGWGWQTFSGHRLDCPRDAEAGRIRERIEREDREAREPPRGRRIGDRFYGEDEMPTPAEWRDDDR